MNNPLNALGYHILLALAQGPQHGYVLMKLVADESGQRYRPGPATLYHTIARLADQGWLKEVPAPADNRDERRKYYALTPSGQQVVREETASLMEIASRAQAKLGQVMA